MVLRLHVWKLHTMDAGSLMVAGNNLLPLLTAPVLAAPLHTLAKMPLPNTCTPAKDSHCVCRSAHRSRGPCAASPGSTGGACSSCPAAASNAAEACGARAGTKSWRRCLLWQGGREERFPAALQVLKTCRPSSVTAAPQNHAGLVLGKTTGDDIALPRRMGVGALVKPPGAS